MAPQENRTSNRKCAAEGHGRQPQSTPTSCLDGPMEPAPTEPVGASDTSVSASNRRTMGAIFGNDSLIKQFSRLAFFTALFRTLIIAFCRPKIRLAPLNSIKKMDPQCVLFSTTQCV